MIEDDEALLISIKENNGDEDNEYLHLYVEVVSNPFEPLLEDPEVGLSAPNIANDANANSNDDM